MDNKKVTVKDLEWLKRIAKKIAESEPRNKEDIKNDITCWSYYNNKPNAKKYEYLIHKGDARMPMYTVHIPCQRPICDSLTSQQVKRTWQFTTKAVDRDSIKAKFEEKIKAFTKAKEEEAKARLDFIEDYILQMTLQMQQIEQYMQTEPETEEEAQQMQQLQQQYPLIKREFEKIMKRITEQQLLTQEKIDEIENYYKYTHKDIREILSQKLMVKLRKDFRVKAKSVESFTQKIVTGKEAFLVYCDEKTNEFIYEILDRTNIKYPSIKGIKYIQDSPWVSYVDTISEQDLKMLYNDELKKLGVDLTKELRNNNMGTEQGSFVSTPGFGAIYTGGLTKEQEVSRESGIVRERIWFKDVKEVRFRSTINTRDDAIVKEFIHMIPFDKILLEKSKYKYIKAEVNGVKKAFYVSKTNKMERYNVDEVELYDETKEKIITKYTKDRYSCVILNNMWVVDGKRDIKINRKRDKHSAFNLPIFGKTFSSVTDQPYSVIKNTIDLQDLYNGIYMLRQLAYAIAGAKGNVIDKSQKPDGMTQDEWEANIAQGRLYIQTIGADGRRINSSFNQWTQFDNTVSASVQYYDNVLFQIKETMGDIVGVPRQRQGQIIAGDLVGNTEIALQQAFLITEVIYEEHDEIEAMALNELLSLYLKYGKLDNTYLSFNDKTEGEEIFYLEDNIFNDCDIELIVENNNKEMQDLEFFKQVIQSEYGRGSINAHDLAELSSIDSVKEMQKKTKDIIERNQKIAQQSQMQAIEANKQAQMELKQFEHDLIEQANEHGKFIAEKQLEISAFLAQLQAEKEQKELELKMYIEDNKHNRELMKIESEEKVEMAYLEEQAKSTSLQQQLDALRTKYDILFESIRLQLQKKGLDINLELGRKINKSTSATTRMNKKNPVKIKDR